MAIRTYKVTLDSKNTIAPEPVFLRQGDKTGAVVIDATLMDNGTPVSLSGLTPIFKANTADGQAVIADSDGFKIVNSSGGEFTYKVPSQLGAVDGKIKIAYFSFSDSSGAQSTFNVVFVVEKAVDMAHEHAKDWVSNLNEIIDQYNHWVNDAHSSWSDFVDVNKEIIESIDPGGALLAEVIDARDDGKKTFTTLRERLNQTISVNTDYQSSDNVDPIFKDEVERVLSKIDESKFNLVVNTDDHYQERTTYGRFMNWPGISQKSMRHYSNLTALGQKADAIIAGGDNMHPDYLNIEVGKKDMEIVANKVLDNPTKGDRFMVLGNHDVGDSVTIFNGTGKFKLEDVISENEVKQYYRTATSEFGEVRNGDSLYFYKDYPDKNIRLIGLVTEDTQELLGTDGYVKYTRLNNHVFSQAQLNWVANVALMTTPKDYHVVMYGHAPLLENKYDGKLQINSNELADIINAWINGQSSSIISDPQNVDYPVNINVDYSGRGAGIFVGYFCGHNHKEAMRDFHGIKIINLMHSICEKGYSNVDRHPDTVSEDAQTVVSVDTNKRVVNLIGFGAATDRNFEY